MLFRVVEFVANDNSHDEVTAGFNLVDRVTRVERFASLPCRERRLLFFHMSSSPDAAVAHVGKKRS
jgi:hypothetical protein